MGTLEQWDDKSDNTGLVVFTTLPNFQVVCHHANFAVLILTYALLKCTYKKQNKNYTVTT